jgi:glutathione S-transferase
MTPVITAFERSPDRGRGLARDTRVRWALEEAGQPYEVHLLSFGEMKEPAHRALHPFGQIPTYEEGGLTLFESGAIVFHIAERHAGLLPDDADARAGSSRVASVTGWANFPVALAVPTGSKVSSAPATC